MPTTFVKGDLFEDSAAGAAGSHRALAFGADCSGSMGSGIAVAFKKRFGAFAEAFAAHGASGKMQLGDVFHWNAASGASAAEGADAKGDVVVYALGIQHGDKKPKVSIIERAVATMVGRALGDGVTRIALPLVGAGKDGVDRVRLKRVLAEVGGASAVDLVVFEQFVRGSSAPSSNDASTEPSE